MACLKKSIQGHQSVLGFWSEFLRQKKSSATLGLIGVDGVGKRKTAWAMMQEALCVQAGSEIASGACGECPSCLRVEKGSHESILVVGPANDQIKIDQARQILDFLSLRSLTSRRFVLVERAETLNLQAANSLLKILEDPPEGTFFLLLTTNPSALLPTIRSRCLMLRFRPLSVEELQAAQAHKIPEWILTASRGSFSRLEKLSKSETQDFRKQAGQFLLSALDRNDFLMDTDWRSQVKEREYFRSLWSYWMELLRDCLVLKSQRPDLLTCPDQREILEQINLSQSEANLDDILNRVVLMERDLSIPRDPQLVIEQFHIESKN